MNNTQLYILFVGALIYGPLFGKKWLGAMNEDKHTDKWFPKNAKETMKLVTFTLSYSHFCSFKI